MLVAMATGLPVANAQTVAKKHNYDLYFHWGYNRSYYETSDIHVQNSDGKFDFVLQDVRAKDVPERYNSKAYLNPGYFTIPQFNFRFGVMIDKKWAISGGWDHLKYRVSANQTVKINGKIDGKNYENENIILTSDFFRMEHTDGLNYIHVNLDRVFEIYKTKGNWFKAEAAVGVGTGPVCPWTDTRLFNTFYRNPSIHFAGWAVSVNVAPRFTFKDRFFVEHMFRIGHVQLWDILIERDKTSADQKIEYFERNITAGFIFPLKKRSKEEAPKVGFN